MTSTVIWVLVLTVLHTGLCFVVALCPANCSCHVFKNLHMADCKDRGLKTLPRRGSDMYQYLELSDNKLARLPLEDAFSEFPVVQILNLSQNFMTELTPHVFRGLRYLHTLDLSHNLLRLHHSIHANFIKDNYVTWLSLARNVDIGRELERVSVISDNKNTSAWFYSDSLQVLILSGCDLERLPRWLVRGLPAITTLDVSNNKLKVLPMLTVVTTCRLQMIGLGNNDWKCSDCEIVRTNNYFVDKSISTLFNYTFCPSSKTFEQNCDLQLTLEEEYEKSLCHNKSISEKQIYEEPPSLWFYIGIIAGSIVGLVFLSLIINSVCSSLCKKRAKTSPKPRTSSVIRDQELLQVLPRSIDHPHSNMYQQSS